MLSIDEDEAYLYTQVLTDLQNFVPSIQVFSLSESLETLLQKAFQEHLSLNKPPTSA